MNLFAKMQISNRPISVVSFDIFIYKHYPPSPVYIKHVYIKYFSFTQI